MRIDEDIKSAITNSKEVCIISHVSPDGDGLGSSCALGLALKSAGKNVSIVMEDEIPDVYKFLPGSELVRVYDGNKHRYDTVIVLDTGDEDRIGERIGIFRSTDNTINIDHHITNKNYARYNLIDVNASSVGEVVYFLLKDMGFEINPDIAVNLYIAILTDTGSFNYANTSAKCHRVAADLLEHGVNAGEVSQLIYENTSVERIRLTGEAMGTLEMHCGGKLAVASVTDDMIRRIGAKEEDSEGIVDFIRKIKDVKVAVLVRSKDESATRVNLRSKGQIDVSRIAEMFSGGGHEKAAGCTIKAPIDEAKKMVVKEVEQVLKSAES